MRRLLRNQLRVIDPEPGRHRQSRSSTRAWRWNSLAALEKTRITGYCGNVWSVTRPVERDLIGGRWAPWLPGRQDARRVALYVGIP